MALLNATLNQQDLPQADNFDPLPAGWYDAVIEEAEVKDNNSGTGKYINIRFSVNGPTHQGRKLFTIINYIHQNPKAQEIGLKQINALISALGINSLTDTDQLIGGNVSIKVTVKKDEQYGDGNEVKGYKSLVDSPSKTSMPIASSMPQQSAMPAQQQQNQQQRPPQNNSSVPAWATPQQQTQPQQQPTDFDDDVPF